MLFLISALFVFASVTQTSQEQEPPQPDACIDRFKKSDWLNVGAHSNHKMRKSGDKNLARLKRSLDALTAIKISHIIGNTSEVQVCRRILSHFGEKQACRQNSNLPIVDKCKLSCGACDEMSLKALTTMASKDARQRKLPSRRILVSDHKRAHVHINGHPKSGTTLLEEVLKGIVLTACDRRFCSANGQSFRDPFGIEVSIGEGSDPRRLLFRARTSACEVIDPALASLLSLC